MPVNEKSFTFTHAEVKNYTTNSTCSDGLSSGINFMEFDILLGKQNFNLPLPLFNLFKADN